MSFEPAETVGFTTTSAALPVTVSSAARTDSSSSQTVVGTMATPSASRSSRYRLSRFHRMVWAQLSTGVVAARASSQASQAAGRWV